MDVGRYLEAGCQAPGAGAGGTAEVYGKGMGALQPA